MHLRSKHLIPALAGAAVLLAVPAVSARADSTASLPQLNGFHQMVVDDSAGYIFLSEGTGGGGIAVTDLSGTYETTLDSGDNVEGLALSSDGGTLYAAVAKGTDAGKVAAITVSSITSAPSQTFYSLGSGDVPYSLAVQSGKLWVSYGGSIGDIDLSTGAFTADAAGGSWPRTPILAADPEDTGVLVAGAPGLSPAPVATFDVANDPATALAQTSGLTDGNGSDGCTSLNDLAVVPGGTEFVPACGDPYSESAFSTATLKLQNTYPANAYPSSVAIAADGTVAAGASGVPNAIYIYSPGSSSPLNTFQLTGPLPPDGLAWSADESRLYAVVENGSSYSLSVYDSPELTRSTLSLTGPSTVNVGNQVTLNGSLVLGTGAAPAGTSITVTRTSSSGIKTTLPAVTTVSGGDFTVSDTPPPAAGTYTYTVSYPGNSATAPSTASYTVTDTLFSALLTLSGSDTAYLGGGIRLTGSLVLGSGPTPAGTSINITRTRSGGTTTTVPAVMTAYGGGFTVTDTPPATGTYTYTVSYPGNSTTDPATASYTVIVNLVGSTLTLTAPASVPVGERYPIHGKLSLSTGYPPAGTPVTITRVKSGTATMHWTERTGTDGTFALSNEPPAVGAYTYTARYAGSATTASAYVIMRVTVGKRRPSLGIKVSAGRIRYDSRVKVTAHLGPTYANRTVAIYARTVDGRKTTLLKRGRVNSRGYLSVSYRAPHSKVFSAVFAGDARYQPRTVTRTVGVWVRVATKYTGYYSTTRYGRTTYHIYHHTAKLKDAITVTPDKRGQCVLFQIQEFHGGSWHTVGISNCGFLNSRSKIYGYLTLAHTDRGYRYRVRTDYIRKSSDHSNLSTAGYWFHFIVRK